MQIKKDEKILEKLKDAANLSLKDAAPQVLVEILYEYLSTHISMHFEKTVEGIDTLHNSLLTRQKEHQEIISRLERIEKQIKNLEERLGGTRH